MSIADEVKNARLRAGLTRPQLAKEVGLSWQTIQSYELGVRTPPVKVRRHIARACNTKVEGECPACGQPITEET